MSKGIRIKTKDVERLKCALEGKSSESERRKLIQMLKDKLNRNVTIKSAMKARKRTSAETSRRIELSKLIREQKRDEKDRVMRFEHAVSKREK